MSHSLAKVSGYYDLDDDGFSDKMAFRKLEEGTYTFRVTAGTGNHYIENDRILLDETEVTLYSGSFSVGQVTEWVSVEPADANTQPPDGWTYQQGSWYYYEDGAPRSGWICWDGLDYYLQPDGAVTTGWANINGKDRLFTDTGAMRTGWAETQNGTMYLLSNGVAAVGWRIIDRERYFFDDDGLMVTDTWMEDGGTEYYLQSDGRVATGKLQIFDETDSFAQDDKLNNP
jgi:glucan-binding YG repeat protein